MLCCAAASPAVDSYYYPFFTYILLSFVNYSLFWLNAIELTSIFLSNPSERPLSRRILRMNPEVFAPTYPSEQTTKLTAKMVRSGWQSEQHVGDANFSF